MRERERNVSASASLKYPTYGDDAIMSNDVLDRQAIKHVKNTGSDFVDGVISGLAWSGGKLTYAFPDSKNDYHYNHEPNVGFGEVSSKVKAAAQFILDKDYGSKANDGFSLEGFTKLKITHGSDSGATLRYAETSYDKIHQPTAHGYFPTKAEKGGDVWFGPTSNHYSNAVQGTYEFATVIHETGHALGLKHGHSFDFGQPKIPDQWDSLEYSVMTYKSYPYADPTAGYGNERFGFPQTFMMADIAALQHMYGANFNVNSGSTTYEWKPNSANTWVNGKVALHPGGDNIFATIWDGGGHDKYDLSAYKSNLYVDLRPGAYSVFKASQLADLDAFSGAGVHVARGNIFNALQYNNDKRSLIEDAVGGSGNDLLWGNDTKNRLVGSAGNDRLGGLQGYDTLVGGAGKDTFIFKHGWDRDTIADFGSKDHIDLRNFKFDSFKDVLSHAENHGKDVVLAFGHGDSLTIQHTHVADLHANDFIL